MGGDAILHHPGNSTRVNYISRAFRASRHSKFYIDEASLNYEAIFLPSQLNAEEVFRDDTILALIRHGQVDDLTLFLHYAKQKTFFMIVELYLHPTAQHFGSCDSLDGTDGTITNSTYDLNFQLRIHFEITSLGIVHC